MKYYWLNSQQHPIGSIIMPGNWGRVVQSTPGHRWQKMESQFENARQAINPDLPSRLECAYVCVDLGTAELLHKVRPLDKLYIVKLLDEDAPSYLADMSLVHPELEIYNAHIGNPRSYWNYSDTEKRNWPELLTLSRLEVVEQILDSSDIPARHITNINK